MKIIIIIFWKFHKNWTISKGSAVIINVQGVLFALKQILIYKVDIKKTNVESEIEEIFINYLKNVGPDLIGQINITIST